MAERHIISNPSTHSAQVPHPHGAYTITGPSLGVDARDLVAEHDREWARIVAVDHMQIGVAHAACGDFDDLARCGIGLGMVDTELERCADGRQDDGTHRRHPLVAAVPR